MKGVWRACVGASCIALGTLVPSASALARGCTATLSGVNFGAFNTVDAVAPAAQTLRIRCQGAGNYNVVVAFSIGSGSFAARTMRSPGSSDAVPFNLYADAAHTEVLGDGSAGTVTLGPSTFRLRGRQVGGATFSVYPYLPGLQNVAPGSYASAPITVTVTY